MRAAHFATREDTEPRRSRGAPSQGSEEEWPWGDEPLAVDLSWDVALVPAQGFGVRLAGAGALEVVAEKGKTKGRVHATLSRPRLDLVAGWERLDAKGPDAVCELIAPHRPGRYRVFFALLSAASKNLCTA